MKHWLLGLALLQAALFASAQEARFICGGIGEDERTALKAQASKHDLMLTFANPTGALLAGVDVEIVKDGKPVLQAHCKGALMLADVGARGSYEVKASYEGKVQRKTFTVGGAKPVAMTFVWPAA